MLLTDDHLDMLRKTATVALSGSVLEARGLAVRVVDLPAPIGASVHIHSRSDLNQPVRGEVVGFDRDDTIVMPFGSTAGIRRGDRVIAGQFQKFIFSGDNLRGRVIDSLGQPLDGLGPIRDVSPQPLNPAPIDPMGRPPIDMPLATGVRAIDTLISVGRGQRLGVFASPGLGKSTLLAMMARHTAADVTVIGLVGERGREVRDFVENQLGEEGRANSVVVCETSDVSPLLRIRAAAAATAIAESFRDRGLDVLLLMDSVTRLCQAQRQVGLAAGEPPATKGYPPSVFSMLPTILERCGRTTRGSITGFYAVLIEGDELTDPVADATRGILDGHIQLSSDLANAGHWPAIDVVASVSRVADDVTDADHQAAKRLVLQLVHSYREVEELVNIGAYAAGSNPDFDLAIASKSAIDQMLRQGRSVAQGKADFEYGRKLLAALSHTIDQTRQQLAQQGGSARPVAMPSV